MEAAYAPTPAICLWGGKKNHFADSSQTQLPELEPGPRQSPQPLRSPRSLPSSPLPSPPAPGAAGAPPNSQSPAAPPPVTWGRGMAAAGCPAPVARVELRLSLGRMVQWPRQSLYIPRSDSHVTVRRACSEGLVHSFFAETPFHTSSFTEI